MADYSTSSKWDPFWDDKLKKLVTECSFDFLKIANKMNIEFNTETITKERCQLRWKDIHTQRKMQQKETLSSSISNKGDSLEVKSPPILPKKTNLQEILDKLPEKRKELNLLDTNTIYEFDRKFDTTFDGKKIVPSGR